MTERIVTTREELRLAAEEKVESIIVEGELAKKLKTALRLRTAAKWTLPILIGALGLVPFTGGISLAVAAPIAGLTGLEIALVIVVAALGIALVMYIGKHYEYEEVDLGAPGGFQLRLRRRKE